MCVQNRQLPDVPEGKGKSPKKGKAKKGKKKGDKEEKGKDKAKDKDKGKTEKDGEKADEVPVVQAAGKHFSLDLGKEDDRAVACLLADHELQVGVLAWLR